MNFRNQRRRGSGVPYIAHLLGVSSLVMEYGGDEDEAIAALLHDAVEDQGGSKTLELIREQFGDRVADIVEGCSDSFDGEPKLPWRERKEQYLVSLTEASQSVQLVALADKFHNLQCTVADYEQIGDEVWDRFAGKKKGMLWYYESLSNIPWTSRLLCDHFCGLLSDFKESGVEVQ